MCDKFMSENSISGDYNALYEIMQRRIYNKISSYGATMTGWDDILLKLTEKNQSETQIKDFFQRMMIYYYLFGKMIGVKEDKI